MTAFNPVGFTKAHIVDLETITTSPAAGAVPKADGAGKIDNGWLNTGSGNGLDADLLDGNHASAFALLTGASFTGNVTINKSGTPTSYTQINDASANQLILSKQAQAGNATIDINPVPLDGNGIAQFRFFRGTNTSGSVQFDIFRGNNSPDLNCRIGGNVNSFFNALIGNVGIGTNTPSAKLDVNGDTFRLRSSRTPASANAAGNAGDICWDENHLYICTATNTWRRIAHESWT